MVERGGGGDDGRATGQELGDDRGGDGVRRSTGDHGDIGGVFAGRGVACLFREAAQRGGGRLVGPGREVGREVGDG